jgi:hypothetical protein
VGGEGVLAWHVPAQLLAMLLLDLTLVAAPASGGSSSQDVGCMAQVVQHWALLCVVLDYGITPWRCRHTHWALPACVLQVSGERDGAPHIAPEHVQRTAPERLELAGHQPRRG